MDNGTFRRDLGLGVCKSADEAADDWLAERIYHLQGELNDPAAYENLNKLLALTDEAHRIGRNYLFYLATPAQMFATIVKRLGDPALFVRRKDIGGGSLSKSHLVPICRPLRVVQPVIEAWASDGTKQLPIYPAGSSGPSEADALLMRDGRRWRPIDRTGAANSL